MNRAPRQISEPTERMVNLLVYLMNSAIKKNIAEKIAIGTNSKVEIRPDILINILYLYIKYYFVQARSHNPVKLLLDNFSSPNKLIILTMTELVELLKNCSTLTEPVL